MIIYLVFILHEDASVHFSNLTPQRFRMCTRANLNHIKLLLPHKKVSVWNPPVITVHYAFSAFERKKVRKTRLIESFRGDHFCQPNVPSRYLHIFYFCNQMGILGKMHSDIPCHFVNLPHNCIILFLQQHQRFKTQRFLTSKSWTKNRFRRLQFTSWRIVMMP